MKRLTIITLLLLVAAFSFSQTNATFNNLQVRQGTKLWGNTFIWDTTYFQSTNANLPFLPYGDPLGWVLTTQKGTGKLVRLTMSNLVDTLSPLLNSYWYLDSPDTVKTLYNVVVDSSFLMNYKGWKMGYDLSGAVIMGKSDNDSSTYISSTKFDKDWISGMSAILLDTMATINASYQWGDGLQRNSLVQLTADNNIYSSGINIFPKYIELISDSTVIDGDLTITGNVLYGDTFWDDLTVPATQARIGATSKPAYDYDTLGLKWDNTPVDTTNQLVVLNYQIPHRWKDGTSIYLHIHYHQSSAADTCEKFKANYKWTDRMETRSPTYTTIYTDNQTNYPYTSGSLHQLASFPAISGVGHTESSMLQIVLYCYSIADLFTYDMDVHFEIDKPGSDNQVP